ncbi:MAG: VOC family protein [Clostridia bacterium]|nr:VOC family protein [Clostridia bacterium]
MITFLPTHDIKSTEKFYTEKLGLKLYKSQNGGNTLIFDTGSGMIGFSQITDDRNTPNSDKGVCISFVYDTKDEVDKKFAELESKGVKITGEPKELIKFGVYSFFFEDAEGYRLEIQAFL